MKTLERIAIVVNAVSLFLCAFKETHAELAILNATVIILWYITRNNNDPSHH